MIENLLPWPNGARCAVTFTFDMDAESLLHTNFRDSAPDRVAMSSMLRYDQQVAVPRILALFRRYGLKQTFFIPGWCVETYPRVIEQILADGHEIAHHGWMHARPNTQTPEAERESLQKGIAAIQRASGRRPVGYRAPAFGFSGSTAKFLIEEGFAYDSSLKGGDTAYLIASGNADLVELPADITLDDWTQYVCLKDFGYMLPIASPQRAMEVFRAEFDAHWKYGGLRNAVWHPFVSGRMARCDAIEELIRYMLDKGGVWFATLAEIAAYARAQQQAGWQPRTDQVPYWTEPLPAAIGV